MSGGFSVFFFFFGGGGSGLFGWYLVSMYIIYIYGFLVCVFSFIFSRVFLFFFSMVCLGFDLWWLFLGSVPFDGWNFDTLVFIISKAF